MLPPLDARPVEHGAVRVVFGDHLTFEDPSILQRQTEHFASSGIRHGIKPDHRRGARGQLQRVSHASEVAMPTM